VVLSDVDRRLLERCLADESRAWEDFVDRMLGLVFHVVRHTANARSIRLTETDRDDLIAEVFVELLRNDKAVLRRFQGKSSLATYLTVVCRRISVRYLLRQKTQPQTNAKPAPAPSSDDPGLKRIQNRDQIARLLTGLNGKEADVIRMYHLEGMSYREISTMIGLPENSIGPTLTRARAKMRQLGLQG
jgi:RNA polymerase sigma-70 factor (ECF subfamily)